MRGDVALTPQSMWRFKHTTKTVRALAAGLEYRLDVNTLHRDDAATGLTMNEIGRVRLRPTAPVVGSVRAQTGRRLVRADRRKQQRRRRCRDAAGSVDLVCSSPTCVCNRRWTARGTTSTSTA